MTKNLPDHVTEPDWQKHLLVEKDDIHALLDRSRRVAVLGIKPQSDKPAYYVPAYVQSAGLQIIPVPVYFPDVTQILGEDVYRTLTAIPGEIDIVEVFRRPQDIPQHVDDIILKKPKAVWFQLGIRNDEAAERIAKAGIDVVQDHCMLVELKAMGR